MGQRVLAEAIELQHRFAEMTPRTTTPPPRRWPRAGHAALALGVMTSLVLVAMVILALPARA